MPSQILIRQSPASLVLLRRLKFVQPRNAGHLCPSSRMLIPSVDPWFPAAGQMAAGGGGGGKYEDYAGGSSRSNVDFARSRH